jgi:D-Ala-teichoic acid biosynthesis protein
VIQGRAASMKSEPTFQGRKIKAMSTANQRDKGRALLSEWFAHPVIRFVALTIYYLGILVGLVALYSQGDFSTPPFIYQNF